MERGPGMRLEKDMTPAQITSEIARLSKQLISLEEGLGRDVSETGGNSLDDQAVEENLEDQETAQKIARMRSIRERINQLEEEKHRQLARAA